MRGVLFDMMEVERKDLLWECSKWFSVKWPVKLTMMISGVAGRGW